MAAVVVNPDVGLTVAAAVTVTLAVAVTVTLAVAVSGGETVAVGVGVPVSGTVEVTTVSDVGVAGGVNTVRGGTGPDGSPAGRGETGRDGPRSSVPVGLRAAASFAAFCSGLSGSAGRGSFRSAVKAVNEAPSTKKFPLAESSVYIPIPT